MSDDQESLHSHLYKALHEEMPSCGCGDPNAADRLVVDLLRLAPLYKDEGWRKAEELIGSEGAFQIVLAALTRADLMEHGNSIGGSWLTPKGAWVLWAVEQIGGIEQLETVLDQSGLPHYTDGDNSGECSERCWKAPADPR